MINSNLNVFKNKFLFLPTVVFVLLSVWWVYLCSLPLELTENTRQYWAALYQVVAIMGGIIGLITVKHWGKKSFLGGAILAFSIGLFLQSFGQSSYSYYIFYQHTEVPYPSIGDIGFLGSVVAYIIAVSVLGRVVGVDFSFKININKVRGVAISILILFVSYLFFLRGYEFDWSAPLRIALDFGYPLGQAIYLSIAITAFFASRTFVGGMLRYPIFFLLAALVFQYFSDFMFLYQYNHGTWYVGGINDFMYLISYFLMTLSLIYLNGVFSKIEAWSSSSLHIEDEFKNLKQATPHAVLLQVILAIIKKQEQVTGQIAWQEAKKVPGLKIVDQLEGKLVVSGDIKEVVDLLVGNYQKLFGDLAVDVSKEASSQLLTSLDRNQIPKSLM